MDPDLKNMTRYQNNTNFLMNSEEDMKNFNIDEDEYLNSIKKNYDEKVSILLPYEQFLVSEVEFDIIRNRKLVTLRSNEGIQNNLDFPLQIGFYYNEGYSFHNQSITLVLNPGKIFYIPNSLIDKIVEIKFCPVFYTDTIKFDSKGYKIEKKAIDEDEISIIKCQIKEEDQSSYFDSIVFSVKKQYNLVEPEYFDFNIKQRLKIIKEYNKLKSKEYNFDENQKKNGLVCDIIYVVAPIFKFYNSLPRKISIKKKLPIKFLINKDSKTINVNGCKRNDDEYFYLNDKEYVNVDGN